VYETEVAIYCDVYLSETTSRTKKVGRDLKWIVVVCCHVDFKNYKVNGKSQFRCEVNVCMYVHVLHAVCSVYILRAPVGLPRFPPAHNSSVRLIQSLNSALTSACCFLKSSQSSQISHFIPEEALTSEREYLTDARESSQHSVLMGRDQGLIRFVQTSLELFFSKRRNLRTVPTMLS